ncbi:MAG TPA: hypothetical protein VMN39_08470, partial [Longimicrobiaceae bacterium]|nr:hypothetical protein [Longimicrobiaceae bacterium]
MGIGSGDPTRNPLAAARLPTLRRLLDGAGMIADDLREGPLHGASASLAMIDATLGVEGRPQSGTGQTALLTGVNVAQRLGRHFGPWVPTAFREVLAEQSLFRRAGEVGHRVASANACPRRFADDLPGAGRRPRAFSFAARAAGV